MNVLLEAVRGVGELFRLASVLLARHWPQLLALYLAGAASRQGFLWLAVWVNKFSPLVGVLLLPLAPLAMLISVVVMFRVCAVSLPFTGQQEQGSDDRWKTHLRLAVQVLVPFLAVYASQGLLREDSRRFLFSVVADEFQNNALNINWSRLNLASEWVMLALVLLALTVRKWISLNKLTEKTVAWGFAGGYVEALWLMLLSGTLTSRVSELNDWVTSRAVVAGVTGTYETLKSSVSVYSKAVAGIMTWLADLLSNMGNLVIIPVAWLALTAMIYGGKLTARDLPTHEQVTERLKRIPNPLLRLVTQAVEPVTTPIKNTLTAIGKVAAAGVPGMVLFCVAFALVGNLTKILLAYATRWLLGPQAADWVQAITPYLQLAQRGLSLTLMVVLAAAAVNQVMIAERQHQARAQQEKEKAEQEAAQNETTSGNELLPTA